MRFGGQYGLMLALAIVPAGATAKGKAAPAQVAGNIAGFFDPRAYPVEAIRAHEQGRIVASITIDADGKATACDITTSSTSRALDATTCSIALTKIQFVAARDDAGRNVPGNYELKVRWALPPSPPGTNLVLVNFSGTPGAPICSVTVAGTTRHIAPAICRDLAASVRQRDGNLSQPVVMDIPDRAGFLLPDRE